MRGTVIPSNKLTVASVPAALIAGNVPGHGDAAGTYFNYSLHIYYEELHKIGMINFRHLMLEPFVCLGRDKLAG